MEIPAADSPFTKHRRSRLCRCNDRHDLESDQVLPLLHPLVEQTAIVLGHDLIAALQVGATQLLTYCSLSGASRPRSLNRRYMAAGSPRKSSMIM